MDVNEHLRRLEALLRPSRAGVALRDADPDPDPEALGALAGVGFETPEADVHVSVYVFDGQGSLDIAASRLQAGDADDGVPARLGQNGPMLFYGRALPSGADADAAAKRLRRLASAFAGEE